MQCCHLTNYFQWTKCPYFWIRCHAIWRITFHEKSRQISEMFSKIMCCHLTNSFSIKNLVKSQVFCSFWICCHLTNYFPTKISSNQCNSKFVVIWRIIFDKKRSRQIKIFQRNNYLLFFLGHDRSCALPQLVLRVRHVRSRLDYRPCQPGLRPLRRPSWIWSCFGWRRWFYPLCQDPNCWNLW